MPQTTILVVEDDELFADYLSEALAGLGYGVLGPISTGEAAIALVKAERPDLVLMDIDIEGEMDGTATAGEISSFSDVSVIYLKCHSEAHLLDKATAATPYGYLVKPVTKQELAAAIETALYRHTVDMKLKKSEERLKLALDSAHMGVWEWDMRTNELFWPSESHAIAGPESLATTFESFAARLHPQDAAAVLAAIKGVSVDHPLLQQEFRIVRSRGDVHWVAASAQGRFDDQGKLLRMVGTVQDITERKLTDEKVLRLNRELRAISDCNQVLVRAQNEQTLLEDICRIICDEAGYPMAWVGYAENDVARTVRPVAWSGLEKGYLSDINISWADTERGRGPTGTAIRTGQVVYTGDFGTGQETNPWATIALGFGYRSSIALPLTDDTGDAFGALSIYSTEAGAFIPEEIRLLEELADDLAFGINVLRTRAKHRESEEALRTSQLQLSQAADLAQIAYWEHDEATGEFIFNDAFYKLFGTTAERQGGYRMTREKYRKAFVHPDDIERVQGQVDENRSNPRADNLEQYEHRVVRGDGGIMHVFARNRVIIDAKGNVLKTVGVNQDVTERVKMEDELRGSRTRLDLALQSAEMGAWSWEISADERHFDDQACRLLGLDPRIFQGKAQEFFDAVHPDDREILQSALAQTIEDNVPYTHNYRAIWPDGTVHHIEARGRLVRDEEDRPVRINGIIWDVTAREETEEALRRSEAKFRSYIESSPLAVFIANRDGAIIEVNEAATALTGYDETTLRTMHVGELHPTEDDELGRQRFALFNREGHLQTEFRFQRKDGSIVWVLLHATMIGNGLSLAYCADITERKHGEEEIRMLKHSIDVHYDGAYWMDSDNRFVYVNEAACRALGYDCDDLVGKTVFDVNPMATPEGMKAVWERIRKGGSFIGESVHRRKDGSEFPVEIVTTYVQFEGKEFSAGFARDITDKKRLEEQLRQAEKMEAVGTLAGGVAHDFNNLLTVIMGFSQLIQASLDDKDPLRQYAGQIIESSDRAAELTQSLLAFSRKKKLEPQLHDLNQVVVGTGKLLKRLLPEDIALTIDLSDTKLAVRVDVTQFDQVLMNLATNARDAMPRGGTLTIKMDRTKIEDKFLHEHGFGCVGDYAKISLSDTGVGMDIRTMEHIFDPFFTTKEVGKGTGLGLASAFGIIKQHGGYITVTSAPSLGATFDVYLPLVDELPAYRNTVAPRIRGGTETILVVEDDGAIRGMLTKVLGGRGYTIIEAFDGIDAINVYLKNLDMIDLVILDVVMPGKSGKDVFDEIVRINPEVKTIFMSGYTGDVVLTKGIESQTVDFLQKPIAINGLLNKVRDVLDRSRATESIRS
jgi:PAS domain S-box-containing protein